MTDDPTPLTNEIDQRECGWMGCGDRRCEPVCAGVPRVSSPPARCVVTSPDDCQCGHDHGVSETTCDRCYWCRQEANTPPDKQ